MFLILFKVLKVKWTHLLGFGRIISWLPLTTWLRPGPQKWSASRNSGIGWCVPPLIALVVTCTSGCSYLRLKQKKREKEYSENGDKKEQMLQSSSSLFPQLLFLIWNSWSFQSSCVCESTRACWMLASPNLGILPLTRLTLSTQLSLPVSLQLNSKCRVASLSPDGSYQEMIIAKWGRKEFVECCLRTIYNFLKGGVEIRDVEDQVHSGRQVDNPSRRHLTERQNTSYESLILLQHLVRADCSVMFFLLGWIVYPTWF